MGMIKDKLLPEFFNASFEGHAETMIPRICESTKKHLKEKFSI
jgi:hypothetical protein